MKEGNKRIYHALKEYQIKKLFFSQHFRRLYYRALEPQPTQLQYEYKLATHCWLQRLKKTQIIVIVSCWWKRHGLIPNFGRLIDTICKSYEWTRPIIKEQRREEYLKSKVRQNPIQRPVIDPLALAVRRHLYYLRHKAKKAAQQKGGEVRGGN